MKLLLILPMSDVTNGCAAVGVLSALVMSAFAYTRATAVESKPGLELFCSVLFSGEYPGRLQYPADLACLICLTQFLEVCGQTIEFAWSGRPQAPTRRFDLSVSQSGPCFGCGPTALIYMYRTCYFHVLFAGGQANKSLGRKSARLSTWT